MALEKWKTGLSNDVNQAELDHAVEYVVAAFNGQVTIDHEPVGGSYAPAIVDPGLFSSSAVARLLSERLIARGYGKPVIISPTQLDKSGLPEDTTGTVLVASDEAISVDRHDTVLALLSQGGRPTAVIAPREQGN